MDKLTAFLASGKVDNVVVIVQFAKVQSFQGITNFYSCSYLFYYCGVTRMSMEILIRNVNQMKGSLVKR